MDSRFSRNLRGKRFRRGTARRALLAVHRWLGLTAGCDRTAVRGNPADRACSVFCFCGDKLLGIESINKAADHMFGRRLLAAGASLTPEEAADLSFDLKARLARAEPAKAG